MCAAHLIRKLQDLITSMQYQNKITKQNTRKASLILQALMNSFNAKRFSIQRAECNKARMESCFKLLLSFKVLLILDFISKKRGRWGWRITFFAILAMIKMWLGQMLCSLNTKNNNVWAEAWHYVNLWKFFWANKYRKGWVGSCLNSLLKCFNYASKFHFLVSLSGFQLSFCTLPIAK